MHSLENRGGGGEIQRVLGNFKIQKKKIKSVGLFYEMCLVRKFQLSECISMNCDVVNAPSIEGY